ncbi:MAG: beta-ketoacyl-[acyl-carrier-protein] synthase family protein [Spirochaetes bacterium]|nr:beta-ketoacyl-[acyl-carrier-protein] synthase family protein [Spirochaetota bacterium]
MTKTRVFVSGIGIISPLGNGLTETKNAIKSGLSGIKPLSLFPVPNAPLPAGEVSFALPGDVPRTHALALVAANEALRNLHMLPDAIVLGSTTGGMPLTETLIKEKNFNPELYKYHGTGSVAEYVAEKINFKGIVLTVSTACSSGALAIKLALEMLRTGAAKSVLAGGADALCRLTYHGFNSLQLIDPKGAHPFDIERKGMSVAEGAAMLLLSAGNDPPQGALAEIIGAGLSCDAYHPASPHPEGKGAAEAMRAALADAGILSEDIDYINLHGTGTIDNDLSEAKAVRAVFGQKMPHHSSTKGAFGHSLAASGAIESAVSVISIIEGIVPANIGCSVPDPALGLEPEKMVKRNTKVKAVLSNSFGFGGNNAVLVIGRANGQIRKAVSRERKPFVVIAKACLTGAGDLRGTFEALKQTGNCAGKVDIERAAEILPKNRIRRLKRLPKMVLNLAEQAVKAGGDQKPSAIYFGTGWGALSETYDFLDKLFESGEQFPSPTDFIGSVHNAPAGQAAIWYGAEGANVTATGGDYSFEQALVCASLLSREKDAPMMLISADEHHDILSGVLDRSVKSAEPSDGGAAFLLKCPGADAGLKIFPSFFGFMQNSTEIIELLVNTLGGSERICRSFGAIFAGIPACERSIGNDQLAELQSLLPEKMPVIDYRAFTGEFASASAVACAIALECVESGRVPAFGRAPEIGLDGKGILMLGLGRFATAVEIISS